MSNIEMKWYMVRVVSGKENKAVDNIKFEISNKGLDKYFGEIYIPKEQSVFVRNGKKIKRDKLTYPGYIMLKATMTGDMVRCIKKTNMVAGFAGDVNGNPIHLREHEVQKIFNYADESFSNDIIRVGDDIMVTDGPFSGFKGSVDKNISEKEKVTVNVSIFGRITSLELSYNQIEKIKE